MYEVDEQVIAETGCGGAYVYLHHRSEYASRHALTPGDLVLLQHVNTSTTVRLQPLTSWATAKAITSYSSDLHTNPFAKS